MPRGERVLCGGAEVREAKQILVERPVVQHLLIAARCGAVQFATHQFSRSVDERVIRKVGKSLGATRSADDHVVSVKVGRGVRAGSLGYGEHIEERLKIWSHAFIPNIAASQLIMPATPTYVMH